MKRIFLIFTLIILFSFSTVDLSASTIKYKNVITDESTIEKDFEILGMDIKNYSISTKIKNSKWYVVGMSESYISDTEVQTYFYIYNSIPCYGLWVERINYSLNYKSDSFLIDAEFSCSSNGLYKVKGFKYNFTKEDKIQVDHVVGTYTAEEVYTVKNDCEFVATNIHNLGNNKYFTMELIFDSIVVIDEMKLVKVNIQPELWESCSFAGWWNTFWDMDNKELWLHFYNFNFPDNIKVDSIEYAKFGYDYVYYNLKHKEFSDILNGFKWTIDENIVEKNREHKTKEYLPGTNKFETYNQSGELEFETFTLGNRITKGEFPSYVGFSSEEKKLFNYDASILLDTSVKKTKLVDEYEYYSFYYQLENVDFLELHYKNDGVLYKCQVVSDMANGEEKVDGDDPSEEKTPWDIFLEICKKVVEWFAENWPYSLYLVLGIIVVLIVAFALGGPQLIIKLIVKFFIGIIKVVIWLLCLPAKLIKMIMER